MRPDYCHDCGHALDIHITEQFTRKAYCGMWGCNCYLKVSRPVPDKGTRSAAHMPAGTISGGFPVGSPPVPACSVSGKPPHTRRET